MVPEACGLQGAHGDDGLVGEQGLVPVKQDLNEFDREILLYLITLVLISLGKPVALKQGLATPLRGRIAVQFEWMGFYRARKCVIICM